MAICLKFGLNALLADYKFGGLLRYVIAYISWCAILANINMVVLSTTAKSPNLNHHQYFQIYGMSWSRISDLLFYFILQCLLGNLGIIPSEKNGKMKWIRPPRIRPPRIRPLLIRPPRIRPPWIRPPGIRPLWIRPPKIRLPRIRPPKARPLD